MQVVFNAKLCIQLYMSSIPLLTKGKNLIDKLLLHLIQQKHIFYNIEIRFSIDLFSFNWFYCNVFITCFRKPIKSKT